MEMKEIGTAASAAAGSTITNDTSPFMAGNRVTIMAHAKTGAFTGSTKLQESDDGTSWTDISGAVAANAGQQLFNITLKKYIRANCTAYTSGGATFTMLG